MNDQPFIRVDRTKEIRCQNIIPDPKNPGETTICNKLFAKGELGVAGKIEVKCSRCKKFARFEVIG